jgi:23S rRNA pseudouridine1911/1915/1917 synthase
LDLVVPAALAGARIDRVVAMLSGLTRRAVAELVDAGGVRLDGRPVGARSRTVHGGEHLQADIPAPADHAPVADSSVAFRVVHEDGELVVVDKPAGLVVHHGAGHRGGTMVEGLLARFPDLAGAADGALGDPHRPGIVHRLDKGTSGLIVVARTPRAYQSLARQLRVRSAGREYLALVAGTVEAEAGTIDAPIGRSTRRRTRMAVTARGKPARTAYAVVTRFADPVSCTLVRASLDSGRTHQVRVHMAAIGHPVIGDDRYGAAAARPAAVAAHMPTGRLFLHAARLSLEHPAGGRMTWESPLPEDLAEVVARLSS